MGKTLDIEFECQGINIDPRGSKIKVQAEYVDGIDFDTKEIAENISPGTFIEAYGMESLIDWILDYRKEEFYKQLKELEEDRK